MNSYITGLRDLPGDVRALLIDLWGVTHNGARLYPGVAEAFAWARAQGLKTCLVSNAPRRAEPSRERLRRFGLADADYTGIITSGELTWQALRDRPDDWHRALGPRVFHLVQEKINSLPVDDVGCVHVASLQEADFVLNIGPDVGFADSAPFAALLQQCRARNLPMLCANPDLVVAGADGRRVIAAGRLAADYRQLGGEVREHGKPHLPIFAAALRLLDVPPNAAVMVGDNLDTDIRGGRAAGLRTLLVTGGILGDLLGASWGVPADPAQLAPHLLTDTPDFIAPALRV